MLCCIPQSLIQEVMTHSVKSIHKFNKADGAPLLSSEHLVYQRSQNEYVVPGAPILSKACLSFWQESLYVLEYPQQKMMMDRGDTTMTMIMERGDMVT